MNENMELEKVRFDIERAGQALKIIKDTVRILDDAVHSASKRLMDMESRMSAVRPVSTRLSPPARVKVEHIEEIRSADFGGGITVETSSLSTGNGESPPSETKSSDRKEVQNHFSESQFIRIDKMVGERPPQPIGNEQSPLPATKSPGAVKMSPRQRRLLADFKAMQDHFSESQFIHIDKTFGDPPEKYIISYNITGIDRLENGNPVYRNVHLAEVVLPGTYPRTSPLCRMLTPIFHPNIEPATICIGDYWTAAERLCDLVIRIGEMIAYQAYNIKSPLDGEAAMWADLNQVFLPVDATDLSHFEQ